MDGGVVDRILSNPVPGSIFTFLFSQAQPSSIQGLQMCICPDYGQEAKNGLWWWFVYLWRRRCRHPANANWARPMKQKRPGSIAGCASPFF